MITAQLSTFRGQIASWSSTISRVVAATLGAYLTSLLAALLISRTIPGDPGPATMAGMLYSYWIFAGCVLWVFACEKATMAWLGLAALALLCTAGLALARI